MSVANAMTSQRSSLIHLVVLGTNSDREIGNASSAWADVFIASITK